MQIVFHRRVCNIKMMICVEQNNINIDTKTSNHRNPSACKAKEIFKCTEVAELIRQFYKTSRIHHSRGLAVSQKYHQLKVKVRVL